MMMGHWCDRISFLVGSDAGELSILSLSAMWANRDKVVIYRISDQYWIDGVFILDFQAFRNMRNKLLLFKSSIYSVQFSNSVMSDPLWPHEMQHVRPPCPSPTPGVHPHLSPLSRWCQPTISSSVVPLSSCPQSLPASRSFQMSQLFVSGGQSIGVSASASVLPMNTQDWSTLGWTGWISLPSKRLSRVFSNTIVQRHKFFGAQLSL